MGIILKPKTWSDNENVLYTDLNDSFDTVYNEFNGSITNANIASAAAIAESKINFGGTSGQFPSSDGDGTVTWTTVTINRAFTFYLPGTVPVADEQGIRYIVPKDMTVTAIKHKLDSGTATIRLQKDTTDIDAGIAVTSSVATETAITAPALTTDEIITLDVTASSSAVGLIITMECTQP